MGKQDVENVIEVRVEEIAQLFDTLDPFPFRERDLDKHAEEYIVSWARELPRNQPIKIVIHAPESELKSKHANQLGEALGRYFDYRAEGVGRDLNELFRVGRRSLSIGVAVLAACLGSGWTLPEACRLANSAAGIAVSHPGTYVVHADELVVGSHT